MAIQFQPTLEFLVGWFETGYSEEALQDRDATAEQYQLTLA